ncbi:MAG: homoserine O-succinyltransferase [Oscillospiraceae bacterium]|jgi:homoserine O-succinyltransferase|nr:homoserine O-succinyltransferase [Oscillospiraceae bacterium]
MPVKINDSLPARKILESENIFVITEQRAAKQDIRPLRILVLNIMPTKIETETQLLRLLGNSAIQVEVKLLQTASYLSKNTPTSHLLDFYQVFEDVKGEFFDGLIITGAPVEQLDFEKVEYWQELCEIMEWAKTHVYSVLNICWGACAALYYYYGIKKHPLEQKLSGVFSHCVAEPLHPLVRGFDDVFLAPHSRNTTVLREDIEAHPDLKLLTYSDIAGVHIVSDIKGRSFFVTGHSEYDSTTLANEYFRDINRNLKPNIPCNYFPDDNPAKTPLNTWRSHANLLFTNWINLVYEGTPYDLTMLLGDENDWLMYYI